METNVIVLGRVGYGFANHVEDAIRNGTALMALEDPIFCTNVNAIERMAYKLGLNDTAEFGFVNNHLETMLNVVDKGKCIA